VVLWDHLDHQEELVKKEQKVRLVLKVVKGQLVLLDLPSLAFTSFAIASLPSVPPALVA